MTTRLLFDSAARNERRSVVQAAKKELLLIGAAPDLIVDLGADLLAAAQRGVKIIVTLLTTDLHRRPVQALVGTLTVAGIAVHPMTALAFTLVLNERSALILGTDRAQLLAPTISTRVNLSSDQGRALRSYLVRLLQ